MCRLVVFVKIWDRKAPKLGGTVVISLFLGVCEVFCLGLFERSKVRERSAKIKVPRYFRVRAVQLNLKKLSFRDCSREGEISTPMGNVKILFHLNYFLKQNLLLNKKKKYIQ